MCQIGLNKEYKVTYKELQIELLEMGLSIKDLANLLGMNPNSITNYKSIGIIPMNLAITIQRWSHMFEQLKAYL